MKLALTLSPLAYRKLRWLNERTENEVGAFGISDPSEPLYIIDLVVPKQTVSSAKVDFDDDGLSDMAANLIKKGLEMNQFMRVWIHTHPKGVSGPSGVDEATFKEVFGKTDWAVMLILPKNGDFYCRLRMHVPQLNIMVSQSIPVEIDWANGSAEHDAWEAEFNANVSEYKYQPKNVYGGQNWGNWGHTGIVQSANGDLFSTAKPKNEELLAELTRAYNGGYIFRLDDYQAAKQALEAGEMPEQRILDMIEFMRYESGGYV